MEPNYFGANKHIDAMAEWLVLAKEGSRLLLMTRYYVSYKPFNDSFRYVTWKDCALRQWLNGEFYKSCFDDVESGMISLVALETPGNLQYPLRSIQPSTEDRVFCLSLQEAQKFPRKYLYIQDESLTYLSYWLRTTGEQRLYQGGFCEIRNQATIDTIGDINFAGWSVDNSQFGDTAVRPCIYVVIDMVPKSLVKGR